MIPAPLQPKFHKHTIHWYFVTMPLEKHLLLWELCVFCLKYEIEEITNVSKTSGSRIRTRTPYCTPADRSQTLGGSEGDNRPPKL